MAALEHQREVAEARLAALNPGLELVGISAPGWAAADWELAVAIPQYQRFTQRRRDHTGRPAHAQVVANVRSTFDGDVVRRWFITTTLAGSTSLTHETDHGHRWIRRRPGAKAAPCARVARDVCGGSASSPTSSGECRPSGSGALPCQALAAETSGSWYTGHRP